MFDKQFGNVKHQYLNKQSGLNQHSCEVDCDNGLEEERLKKADNDEQDDDENNDDDDDDDDNDDDNTLKWLVA